jgi:large subunit ribosomal protein L7e
MVDDQHEGLQLVPEVILKRKHDMDEMKAHRTAQLIANPRGNKKVFSSKTKVIKVHKPETILANARAQRNHAIRYARVLKKGMQKRASDKAILKNKVVMPDDLADAEQEEEMKRDVSYTANSVGSKMVFVIRIRDPNGMPQKVKKILNGMKLKSINEGVFLRYDATTRKQLHLIEPWVTYGMPSKAIVEDLLRRRGYGKIDGKRIPLSDNVIVEKALGEVTDGSVICVDDMVHELCAVGDLFKIVNSFLWAFHLAAPRSKFQKQKLNFKDGGDYGDRGEEIDDLIRQML